MIESYRRRRDADFKLQIYRDFTNAEVQYRLQSNFYADKGDTLQEPKAWEYYPSFFEEEKARSEMMEEARDIEIAKEGRRRYAAEYRRRRGQG